VIPMPMLPWRRDEIGKPVQELKRREFDDAIGPRPRGRAAAAGPHPVGGFVPWQHVADACDSAVCAAAQGEPFQSKGWTGAVPQQMFETPKIAGQAATRRSHRQPTHSRRRRNDGNPMEVADPEKMCIA
jgi:hypothetical protein